MNRYLWCLALLLGGCAASSMLALEIGAPVLVVVIVGMAGVALVAAVRTGSGALERLAEHGITVTIRHELPDEVGGLVRVLSDAAHDARRDGIRVRVVGGVGDPPSGGVSL
jgi:hypothetical protein